MAKELSDIRYSLSRVLDKVSTLFYISKLKGNLLMSELLDNSRLMLFQSTYSNPLNSCSSEICNSSNIFELDGEYLLVWGRAKTALIVINHITQSCQDSKYIDEIKEAKEDLSLIIEEMEGFIRTVVVDIDGVEKTELNIIS